MFTNSIANSDPFKIQDLIEKTKKTGSHAQYISVSSDTVAFSTSSKFDAGKLLIKF
jgi:hypothetical protein